MAINAQVLQGQWNELKGQVKEKWNQLSDEDLRFEGASVDQLVGRIQQKTGEGREAIEKYLTDLTAKGSSAISQAAETARQYVAQGGDRLREYSGQWGDQARDQYRHAESFVRQQPGQSVATAFGIGLLVGVVVGLAVRSR